jgi:hypothetical protein
MQKTTKTRQYKNEEHGSHPKYLKWKASDNYEHSLYTGYAAITALCLICCSLVGLYPTNFEFRSEVH